MEDEKLHHNVGNQHAAKPEGEKADTFLHIRCSKKDKGRWIQASRPGKLAPWVVDALNKAAAKG